MKGAEMAKDNRRIEEMDLNRQIMNYFISKFLNGYIVIVCLIMFYELVMLIRGVFVFDFTYWRHLGYFLSYILLLSASVPALLALILSKRKGKPIESVARITTAYSLVLIVWAALVSYLDMVGHHTFIVYMTVIMGVGALTVLNPRTYICLVTPLSAALLISAYVWNSELVHTTGYLFNYFVFVSMSIMITLKQYNMTRREYVDMNKLEDLLDHDTLTGLKNRNALMKEHASFGDAFAFGVIDIDDFKQLNDHHGHDYGDHCLKVVGKTLKNHFGNDVYRFGGDEFIVVSSFVNPQEVRLTFNKVNEILMIRFQDRDVSLSGGFYITKAEDMHFDEYFKHADRALYKAKTEGKRRVCVESSLKNVD